MEKKKVLCVCVDNGARSVMLAAMLQKELGDEYSVESAGIDETATGRPANKFAIECMGERGLDVSNHYGRWVGDILGLDHFSHIVCANWGVKQAVITFPNTAAILIPGERGIPLLPGGGIKEYRECATFLDKVIPEVAKQIRG